MDSISLMDCLFEVDDNHDMDTSCIESSFETEPFQSSRNINEQRQPEKSRELPVFNCYERKTTGKGADLLSNSFITAGVLERLLKDECPYPGAFDDLIVSLFGHMTVTSQALINDLDVNFFCFRKQLNTVMDLMMNSSTTSDFSSSLRHCTSFLHFLDHQTAELTSTRDNDKPHPLINKLIDDIITHLDNTMTSLEPLDQFLTTSVGTSPACYHVLIHLLWCRVSIFYRAVKYSFISSGGGASHLTTLVESCDQIIRMFLKKATVDFNQTPFDQCSTMPSLFHCPCVKEVWLLVVMVTDKLAHQYNTQCFWNIISQLVSDITTDSISFSWWVTAQATTLYQYTVDGRITCADEKLTEGNWKLVQELVSKTLKHQSNSLESLLCWSLNSCLFLYSTWSKPSISPVVLLWDYFQKQLNAPFPVTGLGVRSPLSSLDDLSCTMWFQHVDTVLCDRSDSKTIGLVKDGRSSYELFLQILACSLGDGSHGNQLWRQLKSRFYSKFSQRKRVLELGPEGICRLVTLFLVLVHVTGSEEPGVQLLSFLGYRKLSSDKNMPLIWKGIMSLVMTCVRRGVALPEVVVSSLASNMADLTQQLSTNDALVQTAMMATLDGLSHLINMRASLLPWTRPLYGTFLSKIISSKAIFNKCLSFVTSMLRTLNSQLEDVCNPSANSMETEVDHHAVAKLKQFSRSLWYQCCPPIIKVFSSPGFNHAPSLPDTLEEMTQFAYQWINFEERNKIFTKAGLSDATPPGLSTSYLHLVMSNDATRSTLLDTEEMEFKVCHTWLRAILLMSPNHPSVAALMRSLANLQCVRELIGGHSVAVGNISEPITFLLLILKGVANKYSTADRMEDKIVWRRRLSLLLGEDYCRYVDPIKSSGSSLKMYYRVSSAIVRHCSSLIYSRSTSCLLPQLLDTLVLPVISMRRPPPKGMGQLIRAHVHHFLQGLFNLQPTMDEFICRKIKQIFSRYFRKYTELPSPLMKGVVPPSNPFLTLLMPCFIDTPTHDNCNMMLTSLEMIVAQELTFPQQPSLMIPCVQFLNLVLSKVVSVSLLLKCLPLLTGKLLSCLLLCTRSNDSGHLQREVSKCLGVLMAASSNHQDVLPCSEILPLIREYIVVSLADYKGDVFKPLLSITKYHSVLSLKVMEMSHTLVMEYELKRGSGVDQGIRAGYQDYKKLVLNERVVEGKANLLN